MPADTYTPATPPPTTPNRWRRRASRLWWWMLPGMIATIVTGVACIAWAPVDVPSFASINPPGGILTALGWSPAGPLRGWDTGYTEHHYGFNITDHIKEAPDPIPEWVTELGIPTLKGQKPAHLIYRRTYHYGVPIPWLVRTRGVVYGGDEVRSSTKHPVPWVHSQVYRYRFTFTLSPVFDPNKSPPPNAKPTSAFVYNYLTYYPDPFGFLLNTALFSTLWMPVTALYRIHRPKRTGCKRCGYSRHGLSQDTVCPECGQKPVH